jgi:hypothetical protein
VSSAPGDSPAWSALLSDDTFQLCGRGHRGARRIRWTHGRGPQGDKVLEAHGVHSYVTYPRSRPIVVASKDAAVLRYVADSVLSVPPGAGGMRSMFITSGLRLLRLPLTWSCAAVARATGVVLVGRSG